MTKKPKAKIKILLVEDDKITIELYSEIFKKSGFGFEVADWGKKAIEKLEQIRQGKAEKPDLVLLDLILPDMNGITVLEEILKYPETKDLLVVPLTNYTDPELNRELKEKGVSNILIKTSYTPSKLVSAIKQVLKKKK